MPRFALSALGADRPGIVAAVSGSLVDAGCNLEDSTMTILQGHFAILLVVAAPEAVTAESLEAALAPAAERFDLVTVVRPLAEPAPGMPAEPEGEQWTISVHGADRSGIVHGVTVALAEAGGNVLDLSTHLVGDAASPVYVMTLRVALPPEPAGPVAAERVRHAAEALGVHCSVHRDEPETL